MLLTKRKNNIPPNKFSTKIEFNDLTKAEQEISKFIKKNKLNDSCDPLLITKGKVTDNERTIYDYHKRWEDLYKFCVLRKDYQSATICN
jgi:hypothetical protein